MASSTCVFQCCVVSSVNSTFFGDDEHETNKANARGSANKNAIVCFDSFRIINSLVWIQARATLVARASIDIQLRLVITVWTTNTVIGVADVILHDEGLAVLGLEHQFLVQNL